MPLKKLKLMGHIYPVTYFVAASQTLGQPPENHGIFLMAIK